MALLIDAGRVAAYFESVVSFINEYWWIHDFRVVDIYANDQLGSLPEGWADVLRSLDSRSVGAFVDAAPSEVRAAASDGRVSTASLQTWPTSLRAFVEQSRALSRLSSGAAAETTAPAKGLRAKKQHELDRLVPLIADLASRFPSERVVDVGCGLGHLARRLQTSVRVPVVGVDCDEALCVRARQRPAAPTVERVTVSANGAFAHFLAEQPSSVVSLHGCGDLQPHLFRSAQPSSSRLLICVGCCYHKMSHVDGAFGNLPMSAALQRVVSAKGLHLGQAGLRLAAQETLARWRVQTARDHTFHRNSVVVRAVQQVAINRGCQRHTHDIVSARQVSVSSSRVRRHDVAKTCENIDKLFETDQRLQCIRHIFNDYRDLTPLVEPFTALQYMMQGSLESLILLDRASFLTEKGYRVQLMPLFAAELSPRNTAIIATSESQTI